ncbi:MAG: type III polyketide synthase [Sphingopyxis sp.]
MTHAPPPLPAQIEKLATATPGHDVHQPFIDWAVPRIADERTRALFSRMAGRSGIEHRWSVLSPTPDGGSPVDAGGFYDHDPLPATSTRMAAYAQAAPELALAAIAKLGCEPSRITHLVVASCTGFVAPGIDQIIAQKMGLSPHVERTLIGFMGCYAGVTALRTARHIVRSQPDAVVLLVSVELSTLHLDDQSDIEPLLAMLQFSDGAAAAIISTAPGGVSIGPGLSLAMPDSDALIRWDIGDHGFVMHLSGAVPGRIEKALSQPDVQAALFPDSVPTHLAIHAGGRSILDAVERSLNLSADALSHSRNTLRDFGNMSSATIFFAIEGLMKAGVHGPGLALAFGPGLAAEAVALDFHP